MAYSIMHITCCEQGQEISAVCRKAVDWGFDGMETSPAERPLCLEGPRAGDREWIARQDIACPKRLLAELSP